MWQPTASISTLKQRARFLAAIRQFFAARDVYEVDVPILAQTTATDPFIDSFSSEFIAANGEAQTYYLQTSPEYAMKRLLAAGSGAIYYLGKAFRNGECGRQHNPEFTMLEWYRPGFDHHDLMQEMDVFLQTLLGCEPAIKISYGELLQHHAGINPHTVSLSDIQTRVADLGITIAPLTCVDDYLDVIMTHVIEPQLGLEAPCFVYDYPQGQAALARLAKRDEYTIAERFEVYYHGVELANGFHELCDAKEQARRFAEDLSMRANNNKRELPLPQTLLTALEHGLPTCAGVALGVDRLLMLALGQTELAAVLPFSFFAA